MLWRRGWVAGWVSVRHTPVLYQNGYGYLKTFSTFLYAIILVSFHPWVDTQFQGKPLQRFSYDFRQKSPFISQRVRDRPIVIPDDIAKFWSNPQHSPRSDLKCASITTSNGHNLPWVNEVRYLGTYIISHRHIKCSATQAKKSFHRSINAIFGKVGRITSE